MLTVPKEVAIALTFLVVEVRKAIKRDTIQIIKLRVKILNIKAER